jgi:hypothetical protein
MSDLETFREGLQGLPFSSSGVAHKNGFRFRLIASVDEST